MSKEYLYDSMGYGIQIDITKTYNPSKEGQSVDTRDLGVLLCYLGAVHSEHDEQLMKKTLTYCQDLSSRIRETGIIMH